MNPPSEPQIVDVHSHIYPDCYLKTLEPRSVFPRIIRRENEQFLDIFPPEIGGEIGRPMTPAFRDVDEKLAFMDRFGIDRSVVSLGNPWLNPMPDKAGDLLARQVNIEFSAYSGRTNARLAAMGVLPASSIEAAAGELAFIADAAGLVGVSAGPTIAGLKLDDPSLDDFWEELARIDLPIFIHPENGIGSAEMNTYGLALPLGLAFPFETTLAAAQLVLGGVLEKHPGLRILLAHGGGALPFLSGRLDAVWRAGRSLQARLPKPPSEYVKQFFFDGVVYAAPAMRALAELAGPGRILFGSDHPFDVADPRANIEAAAAVFDDEMDQAQVLGANARELFKI